MKTLDVMDFAKKMSELPTIQARADLRALEPEILIAVTLNLCLVLSSREERFTEARELSQRIAKLSELS